jgi:hypothetical protein
LTLRSAAGFFAITLKRPGESPTSRDVAVVEAIVVLQVGGGLRARVPLEIGRSPDDDQARVRAYADSDHVLLDILSPSDSGIEAITDKIRQPAFNADLNGDLRVLKEKLGQRRRQHEAGATLGRRNSDGARRLAAPFVHGPKASLNFFYSGFDGTQQPLTGWRGGNTSRRARK